MQRISRAPVLSATRNRDSCWITDGHLPCGSRPMAAQGVASQGRRERSYLKGTNATEDAARQRPVRPSGPDTCGRWPSLCDLHDFRQAPVLRLRERAGLDDPDDVADLRLVLLVVSVELGRAPDDLLVLGVRLHRVDPDNDRLVHAARDDDTAPLLAPAARMLRLGQARDRLALGRALALRLRVAVAQGARQALPLALRRRLGRSFDCGLGFGRLCGRLGSGLELWLGLGLGFGFGDGSLGRSGLRP